MKQFLGQSFSWHALSFVNKTNGIDTMKTTSSNRDHMERTAMKANEVPYAGVLRLFLNRALGLRQNNSNPLCAGCVGKQSTMSGSR